MKTLYRYLQDPTWVRKPGIVLVTVGFEPKRKKKLREKLHLRSRKDKRRHFSWVSTRGFRALRLLLAREKFLNKA